MRANQNEPNEKKSPKRKTKSKSDAVKLKTSEAKTEKRPRKKLVPEKLSEKLEQIRLASDLTQGEMLGIVNPTEKDQSNRARISQYESGKRTPSIVEFFNYSLFARVSMETLADDTRDLPENFYPVEIGAEQETIASSDDSGGGGYFTLRVRADPFKEYRALYLELLGERDFEQMSRLSPMDLLEHIITVVIDDYRWRGRQSDLAQRLRQVSEEEEE